MVGLTNTSFYLILLSALLLIGCIGQDETEQYQIGFSQCVSDDQWRQAMHEEMKREISFYPAMELSIKDAKGNNQIQIQHINEFIEEEIDLLIVSPNEADPITPAVEKAFNQGMPVVIIDRKTSSKLYTAYVGADNYEIGQTAGSYVSQLVDSGDKIIEIWGLRGSTPAVNRNGGFHNTLKKENIEYIDIYTDWTKSVAKNAFSKIIDDHKDVDLVFAHNDMMALGAYEICRDLNIANDIKFIGVDGLPGPNGGIQFVLDGILDATFLYPTGGDEVIRIAHDILEGQPYEKNNILQTTVIDSSNVRIMKLQTDKILYQQKDIERQQARIQQQIRIYKNQKTALYVLIASLSVSIALGAYALYSLKEKQLFNKNLQSKNRQIIKQKDEIELMAQKADEATQAKFKFFTNISHEFRTPLTLILGPIEELIKNSQIKKIKGVSQDLHNIRKNVYRLLRLINQLMDFRKIENNKMKLRVSKQELVGFLKDIKKTYELTARKRSIDFKLVTKFDQLIVWFDANMLDKVLFNMLSNAFKFTDDGGFIHIILDKDQEEKYAVIKIKDNGKGMSKDQVNQAFDRFYQGNENSAAGTGLGLSLSKELITMHKGDIKVVSEKHKGTTFEIYLPLGYAHYDSSEIIDPEASDIKLDDFAYFIEELDGLDQPDITTSSDDELYTILIIEDNKELIKFLITHLSDSFNILVAENGIDGQKKAIDDVPDLIICDIMIPGKDGIAVTNELKSDFRSSHIPVILLTAKAQEEHKVIGMQSGADMYITKPFSMNFLVESIKTLLKNRELLKGHFRYEVHDEEAIPDSLPQNIDKKFIEKFKTIIEDNLSNPDFNIKDVCEHIGFSRVQLYRKVKAILGYSVHDYLNEMRLIKAKKLLSKTDMNISEVAYEVGFSTPAYFSTAFKNYFKVSPSEFKTDKRKL